MQVAHQWTAAALLPALGKAAQVPVDESYKPLGFLGPMQKLWPRLLLWLEISADQA